MEIQHSILDLENLKEEAVQMRNVYLKPSTQRIRATSKILTFF